VFLSKLLSNFYKNHYFYTKKFKYASLLKLNYDKWIFIRDYKIKATIYILKEKYMNMVCMGNNTNCMDKVVQHMEKYMDINCMDNNLSMSNKDNCM
jgi:predicted transcriptional regulator YheO